MLDCSFLKPVADSLKVLLVVPNRSGLEAGRIVVTGISQLKVGVGCNSSRLVALDVFLFSSLVLFCPVLSTFGVFKVMDIART